MESGECASGGAMNTTISFQEIILDLKATSREGVLREMAEGVLSRCPGMDMDTLVNALLAREGVGTTGVGDGVAIPHGKFKELDDVLIYFGRSARGVWFEAVDSRPVHLFFLILAPETMGDRYVRLLGGISRLMRDVSWRDRLFAATSRDEVETIFSSLPDLP